MSTTPHRFTPPNTLGVFLRDRRARLRPASDGLLPSPSRRRTPGLRREEVAARAGVSVTWYTWLEQGRGGPPSEETLERIARALELDRAGRELLFLLAQQRPPRERSVTPTLTVPRTVQRVLDALRVPALVKTATWDVIAWNEAMIPLRDFAKLSPRERNTMRSLFASPAAKANIVDWEESARAVVAIFRMDVARMGGSAEATALEAELSDHSEDFRRVWSENEVKSHGMGRKKMRHPALGEVELEYSSFPVDGAEGLSLIVYTSAKED